MKITSYETLLAVAKEQPEPIMCVDKDLDANTH